ncbi:MAG: hypothetical protein DCC75_01380 [Proteobacteria bacterium]|nr:MAG: hypothetical protein DCC75_01380 [Pseudomonadota bacterium]
MGKIISWLDKVLYPYCESRWDNRLFVTMLARVLPAHSVVLDLGAGAGIYPEFDFRRMSDRVCGIDPALEVLKNPYLTEARIGKGESIPYPDKTFDVVIATNVLEHLENPEIVLCEVFRVLKSGGLFVLKTPNFLHYVPIIASITPQSFHIYINRIRGRRAADTFPTFYRINTPRSLRQYAQKAGFLVQEIELIEGRPEYLRISALTYIFGWLFEKIVNSSEIFSPFRVVMFGAIKKPQEMADVCGDDENSSPKEGSWTRTMNQ